MKIIGINLSYATFVAEIIAGAPGILFDFFTASKSYTKPNTSVSRTFVPPAPAFSEVGVPAAPTLPILLQHTLPGLIPPVTYSFNQTMIQQQPLLPNPPTARAKSRVRYF